MKCPRCQQENPPQAKFCLECAAPLVLRCGNCGTHLPAGAKFCFECATPVGGPGSAPRFVSPEAYTPKHLAERIINSKAALEGERKQVTVLFADLKGSMELLADRDPEEARKLLDPVIGHMMEAVHRYEGTVNQVMGDGVMALFGAPLALEDHAVRACYAALRMQEAVKRYAEDVRRSEGVAIQIRVGLNAGEVVVRSIGSDLRMDYTAVGQTTNLAARMEQLATPGSILVTAEGLRLAEGYVEVKPLGPVNVKGLGAPVDVYEVTGAGPVRTRLQASASRGFTRFVGRDAEVDQLRRAQEQAGAGRGQVVAVVGEPGVGKSRLFYEFVRSHRTHGWLVLESASVSYGKATSYFPVIELLRAYCRIEPRDDTRAVRAKVTGTLLALDRILEDAIAPVLALLDALSADDPFFALDPTHRRQRTLGAIKRVLLRESQVQPLLLVFEDLHWIDDETQAALDSLIEGLPSARVLLCVNYRPEYRHGWGSKTYYRQLRVDPLPPESAGELLQALVGDDPELQQLKGLLIERTEGNPFFLEESVRTLVETGVLVGERGQYRVARVAEAIQIPASVQAILAARVDRLAPDDKRLLQTAAAMGMDVPFTLLQAISEWPDEQLRAALTSLQSAEFIYEASLFPELVYTFKHALTHEVAYGSLLGERRRELHARILHAIERLAPARLDEEVERLAHHAFRGEVWDKAVGYLHQAGRKAASRSAHREATAVFEQALVALQHLPETPETIERGVDLRLDLEFGLFLRVETRRGLEILREADAAARALGDRRRLGTIYARIGDRLRTVGEFDAAIEHLQHALHIANELGSPGLRASTTFHLGLVSYSLGDYRQSAELFTENVTALQGDLVRERFGYPSAPAIVSRAWLSRSLAEVGDFAEAIRVGEEGLRFAEDTEGPWSLTQACLGLGGVLVTRGAFTEALEYPLERGLGLGESKEFYNMSAQTASFLANACARSGRPGDSLPLLEWASELALRPDFRVGQARLLVSMGEVYLLVGRIEEAARLAERGLTRSRERRQRGDEAAALRLAGEIASRREPPDLRDAEGRYREGLVLAEALAMRPLVAHCHLGLGKLSRRTGKREPAQEHLTTATTMYREMGMTYWLEKAEAEMAELVMDRRRFLLTSLAGALTAPLAAEAQQGAKVPRLGLLWPDSPSPRIDEFRRALRDLGYAEGKTIVIEYRYAEGKRDRLPELAGELVRLKVDVIVAFSTLAALPAKKATAAIPIVMVSGDPVGTGLVASLARPGGNVTGLTAFSPDLVGKRLELLKQAVPQVVRVAVLWDADGPSKILELKEAEATAPALGLQLQSLGVRAPHPDLEGAFAAASRGRAQGLVVLNNPLTLTYRAQIAGLALGHRLPSMFDGREYSVAGGLMSYGANVSDLFGRAATFVDRILKGANPGDLPIEQPTKFDLVINMKTAKVLGLTIPPSLLARADQVIE